MKKPKSKIRMPKPVQNLQSETAPCKAGGIRIPRFSILSLRSAYLPALLLASSLSVGAQSFALDWSTVDGGGGTSTGGVYTVRGTIGQPDAGGPLAGGSYSLTGGFWSLISVVQTAGLPDLVISRSGNTVIVSWPNTASCTLQQSSDLAAGSWATSGYTITTLDGTNSISVPSPTGRLFFRLKQ